MCLLKIEDSVKANARSRMKRHFTSSIHSEVRAFKCGVCEKTYTQKASLKRHILSSHDLEDLTDLL